MSTRPTIKEGLSAAIVALLPQMNMEYYLKHKNECSPARVGDFAICSECHRDEMIKKLYGGKYPVCADCVPEVYA